MRMKASFEGINVGPDDVIVVRPHDVSMMVDAKRVWEICKQAFPDNKLLVLRPDCDLHKYDKEEFMKFWENVKNEIEGSITE